MSGFFYQDISKSSYKLITNFLCIFIVLYIFIVKIILKDKKCKTFITVFYIYMYKTNKLKQKKD